MVMNVPKTTARYNTKSTASLSKSLFIRGLQCHKSLWLQKYRPELKDALSSEAEIRFAIGKTVGDLAQEIFPNGVLVPYEVDGVRVPVEEQIQQTRQTIDAGKKVIYEAAFHSDNLFVKVDILRKASKGWEIYEVKAGTKLDDVYVNDAALQYHVLNGAGVPISKVFVAYVNTDYVRKGAVDVQQLFFREDVTNEVKARQPAIIAALKEQRKMLSGKKPPLIDIGTYCSDPYDCDFQGHCWRHIPEDSVFELRGRGVDKFALYRKGIIKQKDIPLDLLNATQRQQVLATLKKLNHVDQEKVREFLSELWYPLYFLDFETFQSAVPLYDQTSPYQQVPFQYSLHYQKRKGGKLYHTEFLAEPAIDPRKPLLEKLLADIPDNACVLSYHMSFEATVLKGLAKRFPRRKSKVDNIIINMRDLEVPFRTRAVYYWQVKGSSSIKKVLPALVHELSYEGLEIADGGAAMEAYHVMCAVKDRPKELMKVRKNLQEYCKLDTLAMVKVLEALSGMQQCTRCN